MRNATPRFTEMTIAIACQPPGGTDYGPVEVKARVAGIWAVVLDTTALSYGVTHVPTGLAAYRTPSRASADHLASELARLYPAFRATAPFGVHEAASAEDEPVVALVAAHRATFRGPIQRDPLYVTAAGLEVYLYRPRLEPGQPDDTPAFAEYEASAETVGGFKLAAGRRVVTSGGVDAPRGYVQRGEDLRWFRVSLFGDRPVVRCHHSKGAAVLDQ